MWNDSRRGHNLIRKRYTSRQFKLNIVSISIVVACAFVVVLSIVGLYKLTKTDVEPNTANVENENVDALHIYDEDIETQENKDFKLTVLGEMMMGGTVGKKVEYNYMAAYRTIATITSEADYTIATLATNITKLEGVDNSKSKYITTDKILNAISALGIDGINVASEHMLDFGKEVFNETKQVLSENATDIIGLKDTIVYAEKDGIKLAIIGVCNEVIGIEPDYTNAGIMMYNLNKLKVMIDEAKQNANTVIVMTHLGLENSHQVTTIMSWFYKKLIDYGADMVLGSHALGVFPIELYQGKPILYSLGYLMHDTDYAIGKKSGIFNFSINVDGKITALEIIPTYINAKMQTVLYKEYKENEATEFLKSIQPKGIDSEIKDNKLVIYFK